MIMRRKRGTANEQDDAPELTNEYFRRADVYVGEKLKRAPSELKGRIRSSPRKRGPRKAPTAA
jgi:hypothetical protein